MFFFGGFPGNGLNPTDSTSFSRVHRKAVRSAAASTAPSPPPASPRRRRGFFAAPAAGRAARCGGWWRSSRWGDPTRGERGERGGGGRVLKGTGCRVVQQPGPVLGSCLCQISVKQRIVGACLLGCAQSKSWPHSVKATFGVTHCVVSSCVCGWIFELHFIV